MATTKKAACPKDAKCTCSCEVIGKKAVCTVECCGKTCTCVCDVKRKGLFARLFKK